MKKKNIIPNLEGQPDSIQEIQEGQAVYQISLPGADLPRQSEVQRKHKTSKRANSLDGATWTRFSISIWSDIRKTTEEVALGHPAIFPIALVTRLIQCFTNEEDKVILDPFAGIGSTAIAAEAVGKIGIGIELSPEYVDRARNRPLSPGLINDNGASSGGERVIHEGDAQNLLEFVRPNSVDLVVTSPPYWDILLQERTADYKQIRHYGTANKDIGKIKDYASFLYALKEVFSKVFVTLKRGKYCCIVVMDLRKKNKFFPLHSDVANFMQEIGFVFDDIIIWDRRHEYNNMRPLGYPSKFRVNKAHEYVVIFQKPLESAK